MSRGKRIKSGRISDKNKPKHGHPKYSGDSSTTQGEDKSINSGGSSAANPVDGGVEPPKHEPDAWRILNENLQPDARLVNPEHDKTVEEFGKEPLYSSETIKEQIESVGEELDERIKLALEEKEKAEEDSWEEKRSIVRINSYEMAVRKLKKLEEVFSE